MKYWWTLILLAIPPALAAETPAHAAVVERMPTLVIQLGVIIFFARIGCILMEKIKVPGVLGELLMGVLIGPFLLGGIPLPGFEHGLFANASPDFPIQPELYGIAIIASIILLFLSGLETDLGLLIKFSFAGIMVGIGGIVASYLVGALTAQMFLHVPLTDPKCMFMGIMSTATSVGITARILSEKKKMDTPEGVTILAGAVIDDVLGVILLAIVLGIAVSEKAGGQALRWSQIGMIAVKEIGIWLGVTLVGLYFASRLSSFLKRFKDTVIFSVLAFSLALVIAGLFERAGLAMIIGSYVVGLVLSKTDISFTIQEALHPLRVFFVPVFFTVMGMLVNLKSFLSPKTLLFGAVFTVGAILAKFIGCGFASLFLKFNWQGAKRIGWGMVPRGEVALIIAGIGLSYGMLSDPVYNIFGISVLMTLITTLVAPPLLSMELKKPGRGVRGDMKLPEKERLLYPLADKELADLLAHKIIQLFQSRGFYISQANPDELNYTIRRQNMSLVLIHEPLELSLTCDKEDDKFIRRMVHEAAYYLKQSFNGVLSMDDLYGPMAETDGMDEETMELERCLLLNNIQPELKFETREGVIWELLSKFIPDDKDPLKRELYDQVMEREKQLNSGLVNGLAIPHTHTNKVDRFRIAMGISRNGLDFGAIDNKPSHVIFLILIPEEEASAHIRLLADLAILGRNHNKINEITRCKDPAQIKGLVLEAIYTEHPHITPS